MTSERTNAGKLNLYIGYSEINQRHAVRRITSYNVCYTKLLRAKRIVIQSIQRVATETAIENSVTVFHIESDEIKGRIIGREGRNIRALEAATGVEIVVDDTPEAIVLSASYNFV